MEKILIRGNICISQNTLPAAGHHKCHHAGTETILNRGGVREIAIESSAEVACGNVGKL